MEKHAIATEKKSISQNLSRTNTNCFTKKFVGYAITKPTVKTVVKMVKIVKIYGQNFFAINII